MKNRKLGIGIVGCGLMGGIHARNYSKLKGCRLVGVVDRRPEAAEALAKKHGARVFPDLKAMLADPAVDAVCVTTVQQVHAEQVTAALRAGKHVFCEKPLALTAKELDALEATARQSRKVVMVGHQMRFHPIVHAVRKAMPRLGGVFHADLEMAFRIKGHKGRCFEDYRSGGFFMELGCHLVDLARFLMGEVRHVAGTTLRIDPKRVTEDFTQSLLSFESGASASIVTSANHRTTRQGLLRGRVLGRKGRIDFTVYPYGRAFNRATLVLDGGREVFVPDERVIDLTPRFPASPTKVYPGFFDVYPREAAAFADCARRGKKPPVTVRDGRMAVEGVLATYDHQGRVTRSDNFSRRKRRAYRLDGDCHPLVKG
jgi:predicted dehydrogenase